MSILVDVAAQRARACQTFMAQVHSTTAKEGITPSTLHALKLKLVALAKRSDLFPLADFAMPQAHGRSHPLLVEENDGHGLYLSISLPGKEAAPHDHGIWCANAAISGRERHSSIGVPTTAKRAAARRSPRWARSWSSREAAW